MKTLISVPFCLCILFGGFSVNQGYSQKVEISLYNEMPLNSIIVSAMKGSFRIIADSNYLMQLKTSDAIYLLKFGEKLLVRNAQNSLGYFKHLSFEGTDSNCVIKVRPINPPLGARQYDDNIYATILYNRILLVNSINTDKYVAGVVSAETGSNAELELYKAQAVLARTYMYSNIGKHESEGFQLCDGVHCQAYHGRVTGNNNINIASLATSGIVVVDKDTVLITSAFHSNCGGYTESARNAWLIDKDYLVPVKDPFCQKSFQAQWKEIIPLDKWKAYLKSHHFKITSAITYADFNFIQNKRMSYYVVRKDSIPFKQIRNDWKLKSGFFSVNASAKEITLNGRGYGHGVGLCQEGAISMAKSGYKFDEILKFYFKGIRIVDVNTLRTSIFGK